MHTPDSNQSALPRIVGMLRYWWTYFTIQVSLLIHCCTVSNDSPFFSGELFRHSGKKKTTYAHSTWWHEGTTVETDPTNKKRKLQGKIERQRPKSTGPRNKNLVDPNFFPKEKGEIQRTKSSNSQIQQEPWHYPMIRTFTPGKTILGHIKRNTRISRNELWGESSNISPRQGKLNPSKLLFVGHTSFTRVCTCIYHNSCPVQWINIILHTEVVK